MVRTEEWKSLHKTTSNALAALGLDGLDEGGTGHFTYDGVQFTISVQDHPRLALWLACELGAIDLENPVGLRWLLGECLEPWLQARVRFGCDPVRKLAYASCLLEPESAQELRSIVDSLFKSTGETREVLRTGNFPDILFSALDSASLRV